MHPKSRATTQSLSSIMDNWRGEDVTLKICSNKITILENKYHNVSRRSDNGPPGLFSRIARANTQTYNVSHNTSNNGSTGNWQNKNYQGDREQYDGGKLIRNKSQANFVIRANQRENNHRVSLADLGQIYYEKKLIQDKSNKKKRISQNYPSQNQNLNYNTNRFSSNINFQTAGKEFRSQYETNLKYATLCAQNPYQKQNNYSQKNLRTTELKKPFANICNESQSQNIQKIKQSINQIKLPDNQYFCPDYAKANERFEKMKGQILQKIVQTGQFNQVDEILKEIRQAADNIIAKHYPSQPPLKKQGVFSFKDETLQNKSPKQLINQIEQLQINLPQFKDDAGSGSISSIMSNGPNKKDQSKDQDLCKIDNIFINESNNYVESNNSNNSCSIKPIIINNLDKKEDSTYQKKLIEEVKIEQSIAQARMSMNNILQSNALNQNYHMPQPAHQPKIQLKITQKIAPIKQQKVSLKLESKLQPIIQLPQYRKEPQKKQQNEIINVDNRYTLQKLTREPVKIFKNLQQAQKFDPEIVKFTQLKVNFLETRTRSPEIIRIPSPLRFRRKQEVVKCLVANNIVEKQSTSIQY